MFNLFKSNYWLIGSCPIVIIVLLDHVIQLLYTKAYISLTHWRCILSCVTLYQPVTSLCFVFAEFPCIVNCVCDCSSSAISFVSTTTFVSYMSLLWLTHFWEARISRSSLWFIESIWSLTPVTSLYTLLTSLYTLLMSLYTLLTSLYTPSTFASTLYLLTFISALIPAVSDVYDAMTSCNLFMPFSISF